MKSVLCLSVVIAATLFSRSSAVPGNSAVPPAAGDSVQMIEVTGRKYEFNPSPIRVKQGARIQLKITAMDHTHGFKINTYPEGTHATDSPDLLFSSAEGCERIEKNQTATIEFVAKTAGTYPFKCCTFCGWHHRSMKGELIVEP
jgi:heme/copper-type cytochrome/quinol oxidase subunit 2